MKRSSSLRRKTPLKSFSQLKRKIPLRWGIFKDKKQDTFYVEVDAEPKKKKGPRPKKKSWTRPMALPPKLRKQLLRKTKLKQRSEKRAKQEKKYSKLRKEFLKTHPHCKVCLDLGMTAGDRVTSLPGMVSVCPIPVKATEVHHMARREGKLLLDTRFFLPVCRPHHQWIEAHGDWARQQGYLLSPEQRKKL